MRPPLRVLLKLLISLLPILLVSILLGFVFVSEYLGRRFLQRADLWIIVVSTFPFMWTTLRNVVEVIASHDVPLLTSLRGRRLLSACARFLVEPVHNSLLAGTSIRTWQTLQVLVPNVAVVVEKSSRTDCYKSAPNPDIVGSGVRCSIYLLLLFVTISLFIASFHTRQSGTKELGCMVLISKYSSMLEHVAHELTLNRSLCDELELGYGQAKQLYSYRFPGCCAHDRYTVCRAVCDFVVKGCSSISMLCRLHAYRPVFRLDRRCGCQPQACQFTLAACRKLPYRVVDIVEHGKGRVASCKFPHLLVPPRYRFRSIGLACPASHFSI
jgi:hypothetical protein